MARRRRLALTLPAAPGGRLVRVQAPADAKTGDVFRRILKLVEEGAGRIEVE